MSFPRLLICLLLTGCGGPGEGTMTMAPQLVCAWAWRCNMIVWKIGFDYGPKIAGMHGGCYCRETDR